MLLSNNFILSCSYGWAKSGQAIYSTVKWAKAGNSIWKVSKPMSLNEYLAGKSYILYNIEVYIVQAVYNSEKSRQQDMVIALAFTLLLSSSYQRT